MTTIEALNGAVNIDEVVSSSRYGLDEQNQRGSDSTAARFREAAKYAMLQTVLVPLQPVIRCGVEGRLRRLFVNAAPLVIDYPPPQSPLTVTHLGQSIQLKNGVVVPNRLVKSSITDGTCDVRGNFSEGTCKLYELYGRGGFSIVVTPGVSVSREHTLVSVGPTPVLDGQSNLESFKTLAANIKRGGAKAIIQLTHPGPIVAPNQVPLAASNFVTNSPHNGYARQTVKVTEEQLNEVLAQFQRSMELAEEAGFDGVQVVAAHGYFLSTFLTPAALESSDSIKNNPVFTLVTRLAAKRKNRDFVLSLKFNTSDFQKGGVDSEAALRLVAELDNTPVDLLVLGGGTYQHMDTRYTPQPLGHTSSREAFFMDFAREMNARKFQTPFVVDGGWSSTSDMVKCVSECPTMLVGLGRATCADPDIGTKILDAEVDIVPNWFRREMPPWIAEKARSTDRSTRATAFAVEMLWHALSVQFLSRGRQPPSPTVLNNPLDALAIKILTSTRSTVDLRARSGFFEEGLYSLVLPNDRG